MKVMEKVGETSQMEPSRVAEEPETNEAQKEAVNDASLSGAQPATDNTGKKKNKKKEEKEIEQVLKSLQINNSNEDKLFIICKKYLELQEEVRTLQNSVKLVQKTLSQVSKEKEGLQSDYNKAILAKSKLEGLCRELQKQNKLIKEESLNRAKEEDEKRKEVTSKFQTTINDIQQQMNEHYQKNSSLREENQGLANNLKELCEKYEIREQHIDKILKTKELETQLFDAKLQQANLHLTEEKELFLRDKQKLLQEAVETQTKVAILEEQNTQYKAQLSVYSERFEEFQQTLSKSNEVFNSFKSEMDKMNKKMKKLEKDNMTWKQKCETSNKTLLIMAEEKILHEKETTLLQTKISRLESLCRALQQERNKLTENSADAVEQKEEINSSCKESECPESGKAISEVVPIVACPCSEEH